MGELRHTLLELDAGKFVAVAGVAPYNTSATCQILESQVSIPGLLEATLKLVNCHGLATVEVWLEMLLPLVPRQGKKSQT